MNSNGNTSAGDARSDDLLDQAGQWAAHDPDPVTASELRQLIARAEGGDTIARDDLAQRFSGTLEFGTAGLRGALGAGPMRMNRVVVMRAAAGLGAYLGRKHVDRENTGQHQPPRVVIGFDARHNSDVFARDTASVLTGAGQEAILLPGPLPTPILAFAVRHLSADAGVMVTASHNPPQDNGYKVYLGGPGEEGSLIVPPADEDIAHCISQVGALTDIARPESGWTTLGPEIVQAYVTAVSDDVPAGSRDVKIVLTPLHGVGGAIATQALALAGFQNVHVVAEQAEPDPDFPTVAFPNPEEPGAVDLALAAARDQGAELVIALDPDADRCAAAIKDPCPAGQPERAGWRMLRGDELGCLLGEFMARRRRDGDLSGIDGHRTLARSVVSSTLLDAIADEYGLHSHTTLTGFKWISRAPDLLFGYEEALGLCPRPDVTRDKDGIATAVLVAAMAAGLADEGRSLADALDDQAARYGVFATDQLSVRVEDLSLISAAMQRLRETPPTELGGATVTETIDFADGYGGLPPTDGILLRTGDSGQVVTRPSGTEPKLKCYLEVRAPRRDDIPDARREAAARLAQVKRDMSEALGI